MGTEKLTTAQAIKLLADAGYEEDRNLRSRGMWTGWCEGRLCGLLIGDHGYTVELDRASEVVQDGTNAAILADLELRRSLVSSAMRLLRAAVGMGASECNISISISRGQTPLQPPHVFLESWEDIPLTGRTLLREQGDPNE